MVTLFQCFHFRSLPFLPRDKDQTRTAFLAFFWTAFSFQKTYAFWPISAEKSGHLMLKLAAPGVMLVRMCALAALAAAVAASAAATTPEADADEVKSLPGWSKPLPSKQYSGYLDARGGTRHLHVSTAARRGTDSGGRPPPRTVLRAHFGEAPN